MICRCRVTLWKPPSLNAMLNRTAPHHLRGMYEHEEKRALEKETAEEKAAADKEAKKKAGPRATKAGMPILKTTSEEKGFVRGGAVRKTSQEKYRVQWSDESAGQLGPGGIGESESLAQRIGSNLPRSRWAQAAAEEEYDATDSILAPASKKGNNKDNLGGVGAASSSSTSSAEEAQDITTTKKKKKGPGLIKRFMSTFSMSPEDASSVRDEEAVNREEADEDDEKLKMGKYYKKLHAASLRSWTKQCFRIVPELSESCKFISCEVETDPATDVVTVFVCAEDLDDRKLDEVKQWVEKICPATKARAKLIDQMEASDRKSSSHVLARKKVHAGKLDPLRNFARRKQLRWIRVDPE